MKYKEYRQLFDDDLEYKEYCQLFDDDLVCAVRKLLKKIEDDCGSNFVEDSEEHNVLIRYFNKFALHKKITKIQLKTLRKVRERK